jgi:hypothetical protein
LPLKEKVWMLLRVDEVEAHKKIILDSPSKFISQAIVQAKERERTPPPRDSPS